MAIRKLIVKVKRITSLWLFRVMWIVPLKNNRFFFQSFGNPDGFTDNPKYLCKYIQTNYQNRFEYIFAYGRNVISSDTDGIIVARYKSIRWLFYLATSKVIIVNCWMPKWLTRRKGQLVINTWHAGGAFKSVGYRNPALTEAERRDSTYPNLFISSSKVFTQSNIIEGMHYQGEILCCGMPRNDVLFNLQAVDDNAARVREKYSLGDSFCVLYAPTFRGKHGETQINIFPPVAEITDILKRKTQRNVAVLVRQHRRDRNGYAVTGVTIDVSNHPDTQELLCCADILITDYSSIIWDYALLGRPCFLFVPDLSEYDMDRGFFTAIDEWPGIVCNNADELLRELEQIDPKRSKEIAENYIEKAGSYENGKASQTIAEYIYKKINMKNDHGVDK